MSDDILTKTKMPISLLLTFISFLMLVDIISDYKEGSDLAHLTLEIIVVIFCLIGIAYMFLGFRAENLKLMAELDETRIDLGNWKEKSRSFIQGLSQAMDEQFEKWHLTPSEKEVALLLIKGLSTKEIADIRQASEKTVRAQATSLYKKSQVQGRYELSAFFLEDLLLPNHK